MPWWEIVLSVTVPLLATAIGWRLRAWFAQRSLEQQRLYDSRSKLYMKVIEPYIQATRKMRTQKEVRELEKLMQSIEYRRAMVELTLIGSDEVVNAVNAFMSYSFQRDDGTDPGHMANFIRLWGRVHLAIRRDLGNSDTRLDEIDMFRHLITDIERLESARDNS